MLQTTIKQLAKANLADNIAIRRHLHAHPELSYQEVETAHFVQTTLLSYGIPSVPMANTGVVAHIEGANPQSRTIALRADLDALPIQEANQIPYRSKHDGVMHACGHDVHTTCLLGAAKILHQTRLQWQGTVKLIFQPGEEKNPGGASLMMAAGVLQNPAPQGIVALHVHPGLPTGQLSFRSGTVMASADELYITISSKGGHAAAPHLTTDTIVVAAHLIIALQQIVSRNNDPFNPTVLSIASIQGGHTTNVLPSEVKLMGTLRCMNEAWRATAHQLIAKQVSELCAAMGATAHLHIDKGYPTVNNDGPLTQRATTLAEQFVGAELVSETEKRMGAEDFGYYAQQIPACFFRLGTMNKERGLTSGVHTPTFNIDEDAIETGVGMMAWLGACLPV
ncbi:MAG: amidohydrolase [Bacteroidetes bacterium]|nr:MAG: amidohydrolase [Bacteroidota bacterium]